MIPAEHPTPTIRCLAYGVLMQTVEQVVTAQAVPDAAAVGALDASMASAVGAVRALVVVGLGGDQGHPAGADQAALLAQDVGALARSAVCHYRSWLGELNTTRQARSAGALAAHVVTEPRCAVPDEFYEAFPSVLACGAGALSRRPGVVRNGAGELWFVGDATRATAMVVATAWLWALLRADQMVAGSFLPGDVAFVSKLGDELGRRS